jgi:predicted dehydrogenase
MSKKINKKSRRKFIKQSTVSLAGIMVLPRHVLGGKGFVAPSDKLNIAAVGVGGRGAGIIRGAVMGGNANIVALCDVDDRRAAATYEALPKAARYKDFRKMYDQQKDFDAVMIGAPDHIHAVAALPAMQMGKHVYVEKPLTHNIREARMLTEAAVQYKVTTQMGNQGASGEGVRILKEWMQAGIIGDVHTVHCYTNRPIWPQGIAPPADKQPVPEGLDWDLWLGPAPQRDYNAAYLPFKWRGWWDYGTGALGDMGCHIIHPAFEALGLGYPTDVEASVGQVYVDDFLINDFKGTCPPSSIVRLSFPKRESGPELKLIWYDGGMMPPRPEEMAPDVNFRMDGGVIMEGTRGKIMCDTYAENPRLLPTSSMKYLNVPATLPRIETSHQQNWIEACMNGTKATSDFSIAGPLTETVLMGNLAIRSHEYKVLKDGRKRGDWDPYLFPGRKRLMWDGPNMRITNFEEANQYVTRDYRKGWEI